MPTIGKLGSCPGRRTKGGGRIKLPRRGVKNHKKYPKRGAKLINEEVTKGTKGMIFQGKNFLEEKLQKNFKGVKNLETGELIIALLDGEV